LICFVSIAFSKYLVPFEDKTGHIDGYSKIEKSFSFGDDCDGKWPKNTPSKLKDSFKKELGSLNSLADTLEEWVRERDACSDTQKIVVIDQMSSKNPQTEQNPCKLPVGNFTWVITNDWEVTFGQVVNNIEWGIKHRHLANCRPAIAGGEMRRGASEITWNLKSGTFDKLWEDDHTKKELVKKLNKAFSVAECKIKDDVSNENIYKKAKPTTPQIDALCQTPELKKNPGRLTWLSTRKTLCGNVFCT